MTAAAIELGATYRFRIAVGQIGICRAVRVTERDACMVAMAWRGPTKTPFSTIRRSAKFHQPQLLPPDPTRDPVLAFWVLRHGTAGLTLLGVVPPVAAERRIARLFSERTKFNRRFIGGGSVGLIVEQVRALWRAAHEPDKVAAEAARWQRAQERIAQQSEVAAARRGAALAKRGPKTLARRRWFADFRPAKRDRCRAIAAAAVAALIAMPGRTPARAARRLVTAMRAFNRVDDQLGLDTVDAEQIDAALGEMATSCGIDDATFERAIASERRF